MIRAALSPIDSAEFDRTHELNAARLVPGVGRFRLNVFRERGQVGLVARLIPIEFPKADALGLPPVLLTLVLQKRGPLLVTGATASFAAGLKSALRQAPDVILIGEMRDLETVEAAIHFAETGHLVLGTLHANNANQAVERMMNFFPVEAHVQIYQQLSLNLRGIISQRLLPRASGAGRVVAIEVMLNTPRIADLISKGEIG